MSRSMVLFPQPLGPSTPMNSPIFGMSATEKVTSVIAVNARLVPTSKVLVTFLKSTTNGVPFCGGGASFSSQGCSEAASSIFAMFDVREELALQQHDRAVDAPGQQGDDEQAEINVLLESAALAVDDQRADAGLRVDDLG